MMRFNYMFFALLHSSITQFFLLNVLPDVFRPFWYRVMGSLDYNWIPERRGEHAIRMNEAYRLRRLQLLSDLDGKSLL